MRRRVIESQEPDKTLRTCKQIRYTFYTKRRLLDRPPRADNQEHAVYTRHMVVDSYLISLETHADRLAKAEAVTSDLKAIFTQNPHKSGTLSRVVVHLCLLWGFPGYLVSKILC